MIEWEEFNHWRSLDMRTLVFGSRDMDENLAMTYVTPVNHLQPKAADIIRDRT